MVSSSKPAVEFSEESEPSAIEKILRKENVE